MDPIARAATQESPGWIEPLFGTDKLDAVADNPAGLIALVAMIVLAVVVIRSLRKRDSGGVETVAREVIGSDVSLNQVAIVETTARDERDRRRFALKISLVLGVVFVTSFTIWVVGGMSRETIAIAEAVDDARESAQLEGEFRERVDAAREDRGEEGAERRRIVSELLENFRKEFGPIQLSRDAELLIRIAEANEANLAGRYEDARALITDDDLARLHGDESLAILFARALRVRGDTWFGLGEISRARTLYEQATDLDAQDWVSEVQSGYCLEQLGHRDDARERYTRVIEQKVSLLAEQPDERVAQVLICVLLDRVRVNDSLGDGDAVAADQELARAWANEFDLALPSFVPPREPDALGVAYEAARTPVPPNPQDVVPSGSFAGLLADRPALGGPRLSEAARAPWEEALRRFRAGRTDEARTLAQTALGLERDARVRHALREELRWLEAVRLRMSELR